MPKGRKEKRQQQEPNDKDKNQQTELKGIGKKEQKALREEEKSERKALKEKEKKLRQELRDQDKREQREQKTKERRVKKEQKQRAKKQKLEQEARQKRENRTKKVFQLADGLNTAQRFAVLGSADKFSHHKHAWRVWRTLKQFGCPVFPVAKEISRLEGNKVYPDLLALQGKVEVVVPCLLPEDMPNLVSEAAAAGAKYIWFQEQTWTTDFAEQCIQTEVTPVRGCALRHKQFAKPLAFAQPCYWHGWRDSKVPSRRYNL